MFGDCMTKFNFLFSVIFLSAIFTYGNIIIVPEDQPTIQDAINAAVDGDTVVVYPGTYYENIFFRGKNIVLTSRFYETGDLSFISATIINGSQPADPDTASCVLIIDAEDSTTILQGFTITGGTGTAWKDEHSAGTYREGGGIMTAFSSPVIQYNLIINNEAVNKTGLASAGGGGIRCGDGNPKILNNIIKDNRARYGGAIVLNWCNGTIRNNVIADNSGGQDYGGGGIWLNKSLGGSRLIENNTIINNRSITDGGGILMYNQTTAILRNNIIFNNTGTSGSQISLRSGATVSASYNDIEGGWNGTENIDADPIIDSVTYMLFIENSPCIDTGDPDTDYNDPEDTATPGLAGYPSLGTVRNDMGAYGGPGRKLLPQIPTGVEGNSQGYLEKEFRIYQNYPNPFNPATTIKFNLTKAGFVTLKIYNVLGSEIASLMNSYLTAGEHEFFFNASEYPSGIYFYELKSDKYSETRKMVLLR
jgi:hypothetical protein